jgi:hypothetical protein
MIRKVKEKDYDKYDVKGFRLGQDVLIKEHGNTIYTIVGLDLELENVVCILLNDASCNGMRLKSFDSDDFDMVYTKGAKKQKYSKWISSDDIVEVL